MGWFWASWAAAGAIAETYALRNPGDGDTLSENVRKVVLHPVVRRVTLAGWVGFATWFAFHIWG